jgi:hypothetical protein
VRRQVEIALLKAAMRVTLFALRRVYTLMDVTMYVHDRLDDALWTRDETAWRETVVRG